MGRTDEKPKRQEGEEKVTEVAQSKNGNGNGNNRTQKWKSLRRKYRIYKGLNLVLSVGVVFTVLAGLLLYYEFRSLELYYGMVGSFLIGAIVTRILRDRAFNAMRSMSGWGYVASWYGGWDRSGN